MFGIIKFAIWIVLFLVAAYFVLNFFGYEVNRDYFSGAKKQCEEKMKECTNEVFHQGVDNAKCNFQCIDPKLIIKKK
ncbi:MAG: hypothetical protein A2271_00575 [Candidatus Moranbacteria bacterium RIFOXYA12_FULL_35_19]|nr:MAG: hypothetical protein UR78_C0015G0005 [Candidatus Moranbacteria bacterium GW2011_GWF2_35_39]OGI32279.1 MAG: hypothetical protein A2489_02985 [Candidatus Moranbacteria bacterium RIFOXYC12_FULL_36_13]OGI33178.1 MAG: hypothetical protein A2343_00875 [Candidatus Moranbacteria bacterium RIFOXYB12_FULL_35_8]OGI35858.1 MAG: hypothetical protein A2271_00575 [Candidatus Moranbacteria bacterium RIFOXYA12_FULL_35_19]